MTDPLGGTKPRGREKKHPVDWPPAQDPQNPGRSHIDAVMSDWDRSLNQSPDNPKVPNPKRTRAERDDYTRGGYGGGGV